MEPSVKTQAVLGITQQRASWICIDAIFPQSPLEYQTVITKGGNERQCCNRCGRRIKPPVKWCKAARGARLKNCWRWWLASCELLVVNGCRIDSCRDMDTDEDLQKTPRWWLPMWSGLGSIASRAVRFQPRNLEPNRYPLEPGPIWLSGGPMEQVA